MQDPLDDAQQQHGDEDVEAEATDGRDDGPDGVEDGLGDRVEQTDPAVPGVMGNQDRMATARRR